MCQKSQGCKLLVTGLIYESLMIMIYSFIFIVLPVGHALEGNAQEG